MAPAEAMKVGEHAGAPDAVPLDDGDVGTELGGDERGLVAGRATADDHDAGHGAVLQSCSTSSPSIVPVAGNAAGHRRGQARTAGAR
jgi:hypothetical protein